MAGFKTLYDLPQGFKQPSGMNAPSAFNPMGGRTSYGGGMTTGYASPVIPRYGATGGFTSGKGYASQVMPREPKMPTTSTTSYSTPRTETPTATQYQEPKLTPFMRTFLSNIQTMDEEGRGEYFDTLSASIKDRMDRWSYRIARGIPLTADQQTQYNSLRGAFNDIQSYLSNQSGYDEYLRKMGSVSPVAQAGQRY